MRQRVTVKLIPRIDLQALANKLVIHVFLRFVLPFDQYKYQSLINCLVNYFYRDCIRLLMYPGNNWIIYL